MTEKIANVSHIIAVIASISFELDEINKQQLEFL